MPPIGYLEVLRIVSDAAVVLTDSGGLQKEALFLGARCVTLRDDTEWPETLVDGANVLADADTTAIIEACARGIAAGPPSAGARASFGDGRAAEKIVQLLG